MTARFITFDNAALHMRGMTVAVVGSGPSSLDNQPEFIDGHGVVCRINNYKTGPAQGRRTTVHYSFYGSSIRKTAAELQADGVRLCMCKCPDDKPLESEWHERHGKHNGIDFRYIYQARKDFWFCDTYVPSVESFKRKFELLDGHVPSTGFAAILDVLACQPRSVYLTGFDFFSSGVHNVDERWKPGDPADPIGHRPELEVAWLAENALDYPLLFDSRLSRLLRQHRTVIA